MSCKKDKAVIIVSFGTSNKKAIEENIDVLINDLKCSLDNEVLILKAFTSDIIRKKLEAQYSYKVPSFIEALNYLIDNKYKEVVIKPLYIFNGLEFEKINETVDALKDNFEKVQVLNPLLESLEGDYENSYKEVSRIIIDEIHSENSKEENLLFIGHGSKKASYEEYKVLINYIKLNHNGNVYFGTLEGEEGINDIIKELKVDKIQSLKIVPLLLIPGKHYITDICQKDGIWIKEISALGVKVEIMDRLLLKYNKIRERIIEEIDI